mgnify:CR=1 FL=1
MDFNRVGNISVVGIHVLLLHFGDADVVNGHEGHSRIVGLFKALVTLDHFSTGVVVLDNSFDVIDVVAFLK